MFIHFDNCVTIPVLHHYCNTKTCTCYIPCCLIFLHSMLLPEPFLSKHFFLCSFILFLIVLYATVAATFSSYLYCSGVVNVAFILFLVRFEVFSLIHFFLHSVWFPKIAVPVSMKALLIFLFSLRSNFPQGMKSVWEFWCKTFSNCQVVQSLFKCFCIHLFWMS